MAEQALYDAVIIGAGVTGCAIARELTRWQAKVCVVEREEDVCCGTSKANSAIVHAGFDAEPGSWKARMNVQGSRMMQAWCQELDVPFRRNGTIVLCTAPAGSAQPEAADLQKLQNLLEKGRKNGVPGLEILTRGQLLAMEPNLSPQTAAGLAAAISARKHGVQDILILERDQEAGGILNQCIHNGFGLHVFHEELTGPEYAARFIAQAEALQIPCRLSTMAADIAPCPEDPGTWIVTAISRAEGLEELHAQAVILAMGCRERPRGALRTPGFRPAGIYTAGTAQRLINIEGYIPGREFVILGSGDIGLIMARRLTLEGLHVKLVAEIMPQSGGLKRNIVQCLDDFGIPLLLRHTVVDIDGKERVKGVVLAEVDEQQQVIAGTEEYVPCDTLLLSVGLIPENELTRAAGAEIDPKTNGPVVSAQLETSCSGIFACGNVLHVHDLVDHVTQEATKAGMYAAQHVLARHRA